MSDVVIVAIPRQEDAVWKYSSEKVPHMTLLYLGDQSQDRDLPRIAQYIQHIAGMTRPLGMTVDHRGTLGDESADVLFFAKDKHGGSASSALRTYLLADDGIRKMYNSVQQYPEWTPHLTMGYPATPAKKDDRDYSGYFWIEFDRIALWTGDSEGPTFRLTAPETETVDMTMSDSVEDFLAHHGVRGMKWGRRKAEDSSSSGTAKPKKLTGKEVRAEKRAFYDKKADNMLKVASSDPESLIAVRTPNDYATTITTGKEFMAYMAKGGYMDIRLSDVYATKDQKTGEYIVNENFNEQYRRSDKPRK